MYQSAEAVLRNTVLSHTVATRAGREPRPNPDDDKACTTERVFYDRGSQIFEPVSDCPRTLIRNSYDAGEPASSYQYATGYVWPITTSNTQGIEWSSAHQIYVLQMQNQHRVLSCYTCRHIKHSSVWQALFYRCFKVKIQMQLYISRHYRNT